MRTIHFEGTIDYDRALGKSLTMSIILYFDSMQCNAEGISDHDCKLCHQIKLFSDRRRVGGGPLDGAMLDMVGEKVDKLWIFF